MQIRFDETADYFDRAKKVSLRSITILIFVILGIELTLILGQFQVYIYHMIVDLVVCLLYFMCGIKLLTQLKLYSTEHYNWSKCWIVYIVILMMTSLLLWFTTELYVYVGFDGNEELIVTLSYKRVIIYSFLILIAEFIPLISYINFLFLRKEKLSTSVLVPSVRIWEIREE